MTDMWEYVPGMIYTNLVKLMEYRGAQITSAALDPDQVIIHMNQHEYAMITATRKAAEDDPRGDGNLCAILVAPNSSFSSKTVDFRRLIKDFPKVNPLEVIIVSEYGLSKHIKKVVDTYNLEHGKLTANNTSIVKIYDYEYKYFIIETPKHNNCDDTVIATDAEVTEFCDTHYVTKNSFPKMVQTEAIAVWLGLKPGMVAKEISASETAGISEQFRLCVR